MKIAIHLGMSSRQGMNWSMGCQKVCILLLDKQFCANRSSIIVFILKCPVLIGRNEFCACKIWFPAVHRRWAAKREREREREREKEARASENCPIFFTTDCRFSNGHAIVSMGPLRVHENGARRRCRRGESVTRIRADPERERWPSYDNAASTWQRKFVCF